MSRNITSRNITSRSVLGALAALVLTASSALALDLPAVQLEPAVPPQFSVGPARLVFLPPHHLVGIGEAFLPETGAKRELRASFPGSFQQGEQVFVKLPGGQDALIGTIGDVDLKMPHPGNRLDLAPGVTVQTTHNGVWVEVTGR